MPRRATSGSYGGKSAGARGKGPKKGAPNAGRPTDIFRARMAQIAGRAKTAKNVEKILDNPDHPQFMKALDFAADRAFGKVQQTVEHTAADGQPVQVWVFGGNKVEF